jgi:3-phenylpropionate/trans-cinnamate dioxygenase ferredoxin reductase subunit
LSPLRDVVIVGASLAGLRAAEELRHQGFDGTITLVGEEPHRPYDRPPLSKEVLAGEWEPERLTLPAAIDESLALDWRLGTSATGLDLAANDVLLGGGERLHYDGLVIATGAAPRRLPGTDHLDGVHTLRSVDDCLAIRSVLDRSPSRVAVVGAGFIGAEVAATCRKRGIDVTLIEALPVPLERGLGPEMGAIAADLHGDNGVDVRLGVGVVTIDGTHRVERLRLSDGSAIDADLVVVGIGVQPVTDWLEGSGLTIDNGVVCDETCLAAPGVVAAGDVARWYNRRFDQVMRVEHWDNAIAMGTAAACRLLAGGDAGDPFTPVPWFWSDQYDRKIQLAGLAGPDDEVRVVAGSVEERRFVALYGRGGRLVGVLGWSWPRQVMTYRRLIEQGASWDEALAHAEAASE